MTRSEKARIRRNKINSLKLKLKIINKKILEKENKLRSKEINSDVLQITVSIEDIEFIQ